MSRQFVTMCFGNLWFGLSLASVNIASASTISADIGNGTLFVGNGAAPASGTFFNGISAMGTSAALIESNGTTITSATFTLTATNFFTHTSPTIAPNLFNDYSYSSTTGTFSINNLAGNQYDLYLYSMNGNANNGQITDFTVGAETKTAANNLASLTAFVLNGNYVKFSNLMIPTGGSISGSFTENGLGSTLTTFNGFQLVSVPEPSTIVLAIVAFGFVGHFRVTRRRR